MPKQNSEKQLLQVQMGAGLDESTPASVLSPGKLSSCLNGAIYRSQSIEPRNGFAEMPKINQSGASVVFNDVCAVGDGTKGLENCVAFDDHYLHTYADDIGRWFNSDSAPEAQLVRVDKGEIALQYNTSLTGHGFDAVECGPYRFHAWTQENAGVNYLRLRAIDTTSNTECRTHASITLSWLYATSPRLLVNGTFVYAVYQDNTGLTGQICATMFDTASPLTGWSAPIQLTNDMSPLGQQVWEAYTLGSKIYLAYNADDGAGSRNVKVASYDLTMAFIDMIVYVRYIAYNAIGLCAHAADDVLYVAWDEFTAMSGIRCVGLSAADVTVQLFAPTVVDGDPDIYRNDAPNSYSRVERLGVAVSPVSGVGARIVYSLEPFGIPATTIRQEPVLRYRDINSVGNVTGQGNTWNMTMLGLPFFREDGVFCYVTAMLATKWWHMYTTSVDAGPPAVVNNNSIPFVQQHTYLLEIKTGTSWPARVVTRLCPYLTAHRSLSGTAECKDAGLYRPVSVYSEDSVAYLTGIPKLADGSIDTDTGFDVYRFTFGVSGDKRPVRVGPVAIFSGGVPTQWDGDRLSEIGWHYYPRIGDIQPPEDPFPVGGLVAGEQYTYTAIYTWEDSCGQRHYSTQALPVAYVMPVGHSNANVMIDTLTLTERQDKLDDWSPVMIDIYRTLAAPSQDYYWVGRVKNDPTVASVIFTDVQPDSWVANQAMIPTRGGVAAAGCLGAVTQFAVHNGRPWAVLAEDPSQIAFGQYTLPGEAPRLPDGWTLRCALGSAYTAIGSLGDKLLAWQRHGIDAIYGTGPNDTGTGGQYSDPQRICGTIGCSDHRAVVRYPRGFLFYAEAGWWTIDDGFNVEYAGAPIESTVESFPDVQACFPDDSEYRVVILCNNAAKVSKGVALVWYYPWNMWTRWEIPSAIGAAQDPMIGGCVGYLNDKRAIYLCTASGVVEREQTACIDHNTYWVTLDLTTGWLSPSGLQGFGHQWNVNILGTFRENHVFGGVIYYDYDTSQNSTHTWTAAGVTSALSGTRLQLCMQPTRTEAQAIKISLVLSADPATATTGECSRLEALTIEAAQEPGIGLLKAEAKR